MKLEDRVSRLEAMLPQEVPWGDLYDTIVEMDICTACVSKAEAEAKYGDKEAWCNDRRTD